VRPTAEGISQPRLIQDPQRKKGCIPSRDNKPGAAPLNGKALVNTDPRGIILKRGKPEICLDHNDLAKQICVSMLAERRQSILALVFYRD